MPSIGLPGHLAKPDSLKICEDNRFAMEHSDEVHVWYEPTSQGSVFDIGMAFVMRKPVFLVNPSAVVPTDSKSYNNLVIILDQSRHGSGSRLW